ncbi:MAG TPA: SpvB/TcaC N-terminal domain-containing protein, partial [Bacteroidia bacterium]|nr:SpvB/TcaC N-terminal domain-containing protein [Bacteroidia bacterium]
MKTIKYLVIVFAILFLPNASFCQNQSVTGGTLTVTSGTGNGDYKQRDEVDINPSAGNIDILPNSTTDGHLFIDPTIIIGITEEGGYQSANTPSSLSTHQLDFSLPVGAIDGSPNVSSFGQASYSIPITLPPGTNGMVPSLSIDYVSGSYSEMVGLGWDIGGLAVISRVPKDWYHDGKTAGVQFSTSDALIYNGIRMLPDGSTGNYGLESDDFTRIQPLTNQNGNDYFLVETKGGLKMELGNTDDSRLTLFDEANNAGTLPYSYYVNKVYDNYGNYINYIYGRASQYSNEIYIKEIQYTGNQDPSSLTVRMQPYNSIKFHYITKSNNIEKHILAHPLQNTLLLSDIQIYCDNHFAKKYSFNYSFDNKYNLLNQITEIGTDNSQLNNTLITYGSGNTGSITSIDPKDDQSNPLPSSADFRVADFNADGLADILAFPVAINPSDGFEVEPTGLRTYTGWQLFINQDGGNTFKMTDSYTSSSSGEISPWKFANNQTPFFPNQPNQMVDFDGDGMIDMFVQINNGGLNNDWYRAYLSTGTTFSKIPDNGLGNSGGAANSFGLPAFSQIAIGDFNGDKKMEGIAFATSSSTSGTPTRLSYLYYRPSNGKIEVIDMDPNLNLSINDANGAPHSLSEYAGFSAMDFDGDGIDELLGVRASHNVVLQITGLTVNATFISFTLTEIFETSTANVSSPFVGHYLPGDYNGDGVGDMFSSLTTTNKLSIGTGQSLFDFNSISNIPIYFGNMNIQHLALDANGDGITDIVDLQSSSLTASSENIDIHISFPNDNSSFNRVSYGSLTKSFPLVKDYTNQALAYINHNFNSIPDANMNGIAGEGSNSACSPGGTCDDIYPPNMVDNSEFETGDFNGDGHDDIILRTRTSANNRTILLIDPFNKENLVTHIVDGYNNKVDFDYQSLAAYGTSSVYKVGSGATFPVHDIQNSMYVASSLSVPDGVGGTSVTTYTYSGAKYHLQGKGFLGFDNFSATNSSTSYQTLSTLGNYDPNYFVRLPATTTQYLTTTSQQLNQTVYTASFNPLGSRRIFVKTDNVSTTDNISGATTSTDYYYDNNTQQGPNATITDGNITQVVQNNNNIETITTNNVYTSGAWLTVNPNLKSRLQTSTINMQRGSSQYIRQTDYAYYSTGQVQTVTKDIGTNNSIVVSKVYDANTGVLLTSTTSAPNTVYPPALPQETTTYVYDSEFRLPINQVFSDGSTKVIAYNYIFGTPISIKNIDGLTTFAEYDAFGRISKIIGPDNLETNVSVNWLQSGSPVIIGGDPNPPGSNALFYIQATKQGSPTIVKIFDNLGRVIKTQTDGFNSTTITNLTTYNSKGQLSTQIENYLVPVTNSNNILTTANTYNDIMQLTDKHVTNSNGLDLHTDFAYSYNAGETTVTLTAPDNKVYKRTADATGLLISSNDPGGTLTNTYGAHRKIINTQLGSTTIASMEYDQWGMQSKLTEPNSGVTTYTYNAYGQLYLQKDNKAQTTTYIYDNLNRLTTETAPDGSTYTYQYVPYSSNGTAGAGQIELITAPANITQAFHYDQLSRLSQFDETVDGNTYTTKLEYDNLSNLSKQTYPSSDNFALLYEYDNLGYPTKITRADNGKTVWQGQEIDQFGQYTKYLYGNGLQTVKTYNEIGQPVNFAAGHIQNQSFNFDKPTGNLLDQTDILKNINEKYHYDAYNRLDGWGLISNTDNSTQYDNPSGNINQKSDIGSYTYSNTKINAVIKVDNSNNLISSNVQTVDYTYFNKTQTVKEIDVNNSSNILSQLDIIYGADKERIKAQTQQSGSLVSTKYYLNEYEKEVLPNNTTREVCYINSPSGLSAVYVNDNGTKNLYYIHSDHLGSINKLTDEQQNIFAEQNFDPWGRPRNPANWSFNGTMPTLPAWLTRGYTGHEHLPQFSLINMNGRMYDP